MLAGRANDTELAGRASDSELAERRYGGMAYGSGGGAWGSYSPEDGGAGLGRRCGGTGIAPLTVAGCC